MVSVRDILSCAPIYYKAWIEFPLAAINISGLLQAKISPSQMRLLSLLTKLKQITLNYSLSCHCRENSNNLNDGNSYHLDTILDLI